MAGHSLSASTVSSLLRLSVLSTNAASSSQIRASLAGILLWGTSAPSQRALQDGGQGRPSQRAHLASLAAMLQDCSEQDMAKLPAAVQATCLEKGSRGRSAAARRSALVQACFSQIHELSQGFSQLQAGQLNAGGAPGVAPPSSAGQLEQLQGILPGEPCHTFLI
jgi:hypothetical protein